ncbi:MAG: succinate dehydrogenase iron-sulfur subunit [Chloroflexi bacterium]|nr:succinate dehydrogenase iron-sulfur subunit [Chloroflexota bacterium]
MTEQATLYVFRYDPDADGTPHFDRFTVPWQKGMTVLDGLYHVLDHQDGSLSFRASCREGVCGSCAMYISGAYRLACQTLLENLPGREATVNPLPHLPVLKDLVVDMEPFFRQYQRIMPYLKPSEPPPDKELLQSPKQRHVLNIHIDCILCAACHSACPLTWADKDFVGPMALNKAYRFAADSRDAARKERMRLIDPSVWKCHTVFNCTEACPKSIPITTAIESLRHMALVQRLKFWQR